MGWIGVDLFFVLSGFLVSGLLFKEYLKFGNIRPALFLIRRGFKIYPIYYLFYIPYLMLILYQGNFDWTGFLSDMTFTQNYIWGWGYAYAASWSLALEEHFYFGFSLLLYLYYKLCSKKQNIFSKQFVALICYVMILCLILRLIYCPVLFEKDYVTLYTPTHFRMDSLLMGVLISYFYHFRLVDLKQFFKNNCKLLLIFIVLFLGWTPFIDRDSHTIFSIFAMTFGLTLVYLSFGILLITFLLTENINDILDKFISKNIVNLISKIGFCSYSIYVIHTLVINISRICIYHFHLSRIHLDNRYLFFVLTASISIISGMIMTYKLEKWFLTMRNKYFPSRV